jgi:CRP/FNR family transcriptional regulator, cyclic AMP receptor protein
MTWVDLLGYVAAVSVLATFLMTTMVPLRMVAIGSNVLFAAFGILAHIYPVAVLHLVLLPVNVFRLMQIRQLINDASGLLGFAEVPIASLMPFMSRRAVEAGEVLIRKGEDADRLYYLVSGTVRIVEVNKSVEPGSVLGEIGVFARDRKRTATVVCVSDCVVYEMTERKAKELYFQDKTFGLAVLQLIIVRLVEDLKRLQPAPDAGANGRHPPGGYAPAFGTRSAEIVDDASPVH